MYSLLAWIVLLIFIIQYVCTASEYEVDPNCKVNEPCAEEVFKRLPDHIINGFSPLGVAPVDPLFMEIVDAKLFMLNYKLFNTTATGLSRCKIYNFKTNFKTLTATFQAKCPKKLKVIGQYEVGGKLFNLNVEGRGDIDLSIGSFIDNTTAKLDLYQGENGKYYYKILTFSSKAKLTSPFQISISNLFNGQKKLSDAFHKFIHENWRAVAEFIQDPLLDATFKKILGNANKIMKTLGFEK